jgi:ketosteroid isomerase-like protein
MTASPLTVARACYEPYVAKDRAAIEALIAEDYHFTSPIDNALDRKTYFELCWPNSKALTGFDHIYQNEDGNRAFIVYEAHTESGKTFRNSEVHTVRNGKLVATEVYFGWDLPHNVPKGKHIENEGEGPA